MTAGLKSPSQTSFKKSGIAVPIKTVETMRPEYREPLCDVFVYSNLATEE